MYECFASMCMTSAEGGHRRAPDPLELELRVVVSSHNSGRCLKLNLGPLQEQRTSAFNC